MPSDDAQVAGHRGEVPYEQLHTAAGGGVRE